jgi:hypothetical protein
MIIENIIDNPKNNGIDKHQYTVYIRGNKGGGSVAVLAALSGQICWMVTPHPGAVTNKSFHQKYSAHSAHYNYLIATMHCTCIWGTLLNIKQIIEQTNSRGRTSEKRTGMASEQLCI